MGNDATQLIGIVAGILTSVSLLPQFIKLLRTKKAEDISLFYLFLLITGLSLWVWYGVRRDDLPVMATNAFSVAINFLIIVLGIRYKRNGPRA